MAMPERFKRLVPLVSSLLLGAIGVAIVQQYVRQKEQALAREWERVRTTYPDPIEAIVAARDLDSGVVLEMSHLATAQIPERFFQPYAARSAEEVLGQMTLAPIAEGEQILSNKIRRPEDVPLSATLSGVLEKGKRAVTIGVDAISGVGGFVQPGDAVDVLWTVNVPSPDQSGETQPVTWTMFQGVPVMAVGGALLPQPGQRSGAEGGFTVTLAMEPQETSFLLFAREQGRIQLSLRSRSDKGPVALAPANLYTLMEQQLGLKTGQPSEKTRHQVEVYKGLTRDVVTLSEEASQKR